MPINFRTATIYIIKNLFQQAPKHFKHAKQTCHYITKSFYMPINFHLESLQFPRYSEHKKYLCIYNRVAAIWCWYWKIETANTEKNVIKKFSIPSTLQFSRILWNLLLCMLSHCVTDFLPHSHYFYGDIRFFLLPACISFFIQLSTSINFMTHNCFYDYVDDDDTDAIDAFGICNFFSSTLSFFLFVSLCV